MSIRKGLRFGDDDDDGPPINPQQFGSTGFQANRGRTNFEKDVDSLLFGGMKPPPRKKRQQVKPADNDKKAATSNQAKKPIPEDPKKQAENSKQPDAKKPDTKTDPKKPDTNKPDTIKPDIKKPDTNTNKPDIKKPSPVKQVDNFVSENPTQTKPKQVVEEQPKNVKQVDSEEIEAQIDNLVSYNRPSYIRKLKKVAEDFNFLKENTENHRFIEVLRPSQCIRSNVKRLNSPDFEDSEFPPNWTSIDRVSRTDGIEWKKPEEVFKAPVFGKYVDPNDIQPGSMSSPQFLSTLSCLAEREENIKRIIENQKTNSNGFYYVRLNINGVWRYIAVDDNLPELNGKPVGARSFNDAQSQLWVSLVQKAYAKVYHNFACFKQSSVSREHYLRDLTGAPVRKFEPNHPEFSEIVNEALTFGWPLVAVPSQKIIDLGFNPNYSLSIIRSSAKGLELRSSWGTIAERPKVNISREGVFELSPSQIRDYVSYIILAETDPLLCSTTIQSKHCQSFYSCYSFKIKSPNPHATISLSQLDRRLFSKSSSYSYVPFRLVLEKKNVDDQDNHSRYITSGFSFKSRNLDVAANLGPGTYYLYCIGSWNEVHYDYNITVHANELVDINKVHHFNFPNLIAEALTQECLTNGRRSAKGSVDEYILYHEPSNLVLITALSLVDRAFNHVLNLQQVKPDSLELINVAKPEDNFAKNLRVHNKEYKASVFDKKTWDVSLLPHEKYTWVFASNQDYDPANFKNWGFK